VLVGEREALKVKVRRSDDLDAVIGYFSGTAYAAEPLDERTIAVIPPDSVRGRRARREVDVYLRLLERLFPGLVATLVD
jgi:hypothetical protein